MINLLGRWNVAGGTSYAIGGLCYYLLPFSNMSHAFADPVRSIVYTVVMLGLCAILSSAWIDVSKMSAKEFGMSCKMLFSFCMYLVLTLYPHCY